MKKPQLNLFRWILPVVIFCLLSLDVAKAQSWDPPSLKSVDPISGTDYYIYNIGSDGFLNQGANYGTQAAVSPSPRRNASTSMVSWTVTNTSGSDYTLKLTIDGSESQSGVDDDFVACDGGNVYTDQGSGWGTITWTFAEVDVTNNIYTIQKPGETTFLGTVSGAESTNTGLANIVNFNRASGDDYVNWKFISIANYDLYLAKVELDRYMRYANAIGSIDLTDYINDYNSDVTATIQTASGNLLTELGRTDVSSTIANASLESNGGNLSGTIDSWTNDSFVAQNNDPNWTGITKDGSFYVEKWTSANGNLGTGSVTQTITGLTNGLYELHVAAFALQQGGSNPLHTGGFIICGINNSEVHAGQDYIVDMVQVSNGSLTIGYELSGTVGCNYTGFDNFRLYYYGAPAVSSDATLSDITLSAGSLIPDFDPSVTNYVVYLPSGTASIDVTPSLTDVNASITSGGGTVTLTNGVGSTDILVTAEDGSTQKTYSIIVENCFEQLYPSKTNLVDDPSIFNLDNFGGWEWEAGARAHNTDPANAYCGNTSGAIAAGVDNTASLDVVLNSKLEANKTYRAHAWVYATSGVFNFGAYNVDASPYEIQTTTTGQWEEMNLVFTTGAGINLGSCGLYFNNYGQDGRGGYIDNWEVYEVDNDQSMVLTAETSGSSWTVNSIGVASYEVLVDPGTLTVDLVANPNGTNAMVSGDGTVNVADSPITISLTAESGETTDYIVTISAESSDANLSSLSVDAGFFHGNFDPETTSYEVLVPAGISSVNVTAVKNSEVATITSGDGSIDVSGGSTSTDVLVTAENGSTKTYTVNFTVSTTNYIFGWDGNTLTGEGTSPFDLGWENTSGYSDASDVNGCCGARIRSNYSGYTYEDGGATVTGRQQLLRYDGNTASETAAWVYPVTLEANTVYDFTFDHVFGGSGTAPATLTVGIGTTNDAVSDVASKGFETSSDATLYRRGLLTFMTGEAGVYFVKFTVDKRSWQGINNLSLATSDVIGWNGVWSNGSGPNASGEDDVLIDGALDVTGEMAVKNIEVSSNGNLTVMSGASLAIMGEASGNATIKRISTGSAGYSIVGAPVSGLILDVLAADYVYVWDEPSGDWSSNLKVSTDVMTSGLGYFVGYDAASPEISVLGGLVSGNVSAAVSTGGVNNGDGAGWNLIANPYTAAISSDAVIGNTNNMSSTDGSIYLWMDGGSNSAGVRTGSYVVANSGNSVNIGSVQGFFVNSSTGGTVEFTPDMQVSAAGANADGNFYRKAGTDPQKVKLALTGNGLYNEIVVSFDENATVGKDYGWDAKYLQGSDLIAFYTLMDDGRYATQGLPQVETEAIEVDLGMDLKEAGEYKVSVERFEGFGDLKVLLVDNMTGVSHELGRNVEIPFTTDEVIDSRRFKVVVAPAKVLSTEDFKSKIHVFGNASELSINYTSNKSELVNIYSLDGRSVFSQQVKFNNNQAVISSLINRNQVYILRINDEAIKFVLK